MYLFICIVCTEISIYQHYSKMINCFHLILIISVWSIEFSVWFIYFAKIPKMNHIICRAQYFYELTEFDRTFTIEHKPHKFVEPLLSNSKTNDAKQNFELS
jgi:hypothetical protein